MKKMLLLSALSLVLFIPAQSNTFNLSMLDDGQQVGFQDGVGHAERDVSSGMWIAVGCITGGFSWLYPEIFTPAVPESPMIGKSPEYAAGFRDGYNEKRKSIIQRNSCIGGGIYWGGFVLYIIFVVVVST